MSMFSKALKDLGHNVDKATEDVLDELERTPKFIEGLGRKAGLLGKGGFKEIWGGSAGPKKTRTPMPPPYAKSVGPKMNDLLDDLLDGDMSACGAAGAKPWTITSTTIINAGALAADTDLGTTSANPFSSTNSAFFTTAGVFPQPFLCYGIGGFITARQPAAALEVAAVLDSLYYSMRASTELARFSLTRDLGFDIGLQGNVVAAAATGATAIKASPYREWRQFFDPRTTYVWGARLPRAVTSVEAITVTLILHGVLYEGGAVGSND